MVETIQGVQAVCALRCSEDNKGLFVCHELGYKETRAQTWYELGSTGGKWEGNLERFVE